MTSRPNLLGEVPPTLLPNDDAARRELAAGRPAAEVAAADPSVSLAWAVLAETALEEGRWIDGYAYARVGYHRGLDGLRRSGWHGTGPVPWQHEPNRGFLRCVAALGAAAAAIGEGDERDRCAQLLADCDERAAEELGAPGRFGAR